MIPRDRKSIHPGEVLLQEFLKPKKMSQHDLAMKMGVPVQLINTLIKGKRGITPRTATLLSKIFKNSPEFWMHLQVAWVLYGKRKKTINEPRAEKPQGDETMKT